MLKTEITLYLNYPLGFFIQSAFLSTVATTGFELYKIELLITEANTHWGFMKHTTLLYLYPICV